MARTMEIVVSAGHTRHRTSLVLQARYLHVIAEAPCYHLVHPPLAKTEYAVHDNVDHG